MYGLGVIALLTLLNIFMATGGIGAHKLQSKQAAIETVAYDGCEYLGHKNGGIVIYAHKGNCTNSVHVYNVATLVAGAPILLSKSTNSVIVVP